MTDEEILQLAREVHLDMLHIGRDLSDKRVIAFATAIRNAALEEAAGICDREYEAGDCAAAIREARRA
jgi:hypothetical protein